MPPVRTLVNDAPRTVAAPSAAPFAPASSAPVANLPGAIPPGALALPGFLAPSSALAMPSCDGLPAGESGPYIGNANNKSNKWTTLQQLGINAGDFYLASDDHFTRLMPLRYFMLAADL